MKLKKNLKWSNINKKNKDYNWNENQIGGCTYFFYLSSTHPEPMKKKRGEKEKT